MTNHPNRPNKMMHSDRSRVTFALAAALSLAAVLPVACDDPAGPDAPGLEGGVLATFRVVDEKFSVWTDDPEAIAQLEARWNGNSQASIPTAPVRAGAGKADHNAPWSWHLDPDSLQMAELTMEVCDGRPSMVEENLSYWTDTVGRYCPWSAELIELEDFR